MRAGVIGYPVLHSRSPAIHEAAARAIGLHLDYRAISVAPADLAEAITTMRRTGMRGMSVTMPHKHNVMEFLDELTPAAVELGAVNHITNTNGHLVGNNTDGEGFLLGLSAAHGIDVAEQHIGVVGAGGAARAIVRACALAGASQVSVIARNPQRAADALDVGQEVAAVATFDVLEQLDIVVNATPVGMSGTTAANDTPFDVSLLDEGAVVVDIVYEPLETPLLRAARERGLTAVDGLSMLAGQAAAQFEWWTGQPAPLDVMIAAAKVVPSGNPSTP